MGDLGHLPAPAPELQVRWAGVRPRHGSVGAWVAAAVHVLVLAWVARTQQLEAGAFVSAFAAATALAFAWFCACWRVDASETQWQLAQAPPSEPEVSPIGWRAGVRAGWRPGLAWLVGAAVVLSGLRGLEGFAAFLLLAALVVPVAVAFGWLLWLFLVLPLLYLVHGARRLRDDGSGRPRLGIAMVATALLLWSVLPLAACLLLSGAATNRYDALPALLGYGGADASSPMLLVVARVLAAGIVLIAVSLAWWQARASRRLESQQHGS